ncbi:MAG TPA: DNA-processing protein DprA [Candidatus Eisenbacteria bacterium]|nr:DNA-processing protein DprA [Candidatus Eisenbacteria bacterium]
MTRVLRPDDPDYPFRLRDLSDSPSPVYLEGPWDHDGPIVAIVGSRNPTSIGVDFTRALAADLAREGAAVVSGLARGIDGAAHEGALSEGGRSGAVLGTPLDKVYPPEHRELHERLAGSLGLMSELPPGAHATRATFASRNRMIAALAHAVVLVQGDGRSGALLTARAAAAIGRPVGAVPWAAWDPLGEAPHALIRDRAAVLVRHAADVLELAGETPSLALTRATALALRRAGGGDEFPEVRRSGAPPAAEQRVLAGLTRYPEPVDLVASRAALTAAETSAALLALELAGLCRREPGGRYRLARGA